MGFWKISVCFSLTFPSVNGVESMSSKLGKSATPPRTDLLVVSWVESRPCALIVVPWSMHAMRTTLAVGFVWNFALGTWSHTPGSK